MVVQLPPELVEIQNAQNQYQRKIAQDPTIMNIERRMRVLSDQFNPKGENLLNKITEYFQSAPPEIQQILRNFDLRNVIMNRYADQSPEYKEIQKLNLDKAKYIQTTFEQDRQIIQNLKQKYAGAIQRFNAQNIQAMQQQNALNSAQQFNAQQLAMGQLRPSTNTMFEYLPEGLTQEEFNKQARINMTQEFKTPEQMTDIMKRFYDSYLKEKGMTKIGEVDSFENMTQYKQAQLSYFPPDANYEIRGDSVYMNGRNIGNIGGGRGMNDPSMLGLPADGSIKIPAYVFDKATYTEDKSVSWQDVKTTLPPSNINNNAQSAAIKKATEEFKERIPRPVQPPQQDPIVDPLRPSTTVPKTITPIERPPVEPIVDPIREPYTPPKPIKPVKPVQKDPIIDPIRPMAPAKTGLMRQKPVNPYVPMGYKGLNTNVTKGLMNR